MQRRQFIKNTAIGSTCALAGTIVATEAFPISKKSEGQLKITILRKTLNEEWNKEYRNSSGQKCGVFKEGQEFIVESPWSAPEGFCQWAWADIRSYIHMVNDGKFETFISCCTDGFRPVFFKIEKISQ